MGEAVGESDFKLLCQKNKANLDLLTKSWLINNTKKAGLGNHNFKTLLARPAFWFFLPFLFCFLLAFLAEHYVPLLPFRFGSTSPAAATLPRLRASP